MEVIKRRVAGGVRMGDMVMMGADKNRLSGVYAITNTVNGKLYIGSAINIQNRLQGHRHALKANRHHSQKLQRAWAKYGEAAFVFKPLMMCAPDMVLFYEQLFLDYFQTVDHGYNVLRTAGSRRGMKHSEETKAKLRAAHLGKIMSPESREKMRQNNLGRVVSEETRRKISAFNKGKKLSAEQVEGLRNRLVSQETRAKIAAALTGHKYSEESKQKMRQAQLGRKATDEARANMSNAMRASIARRKVLKGGAA